MKQLQLSTSGFILSTLHLRSPSYFSSTLIKIISNFPLSFRLSRFLSPVWSLARSASPFLSPSKLPLTIAFYLGPYPPLKSTFSLSISLSSFFLSFFLFLSLFLSSCNPLRLHIPQLHNNHDIQLAANESDSSCQTPPRIKCKSSSLYDVIHEDCHGNWANVYSSLAIVNTMVTKWGERERRRWSEKGDIEERSVIRSRVWWGRGN